MARQCTVCEHPDRATIELGLANGVPVRTLATRHDLSKEACYRHRKNHMPPQLLAQLKTRGRAQEIDLEKLRITESEGVLQHLVAVRGRLYCLADEEQEVGNYSNSARILSFLLKNLETTAKLLGDLKTGDTNITNNILVSDDYHQIRTAIVQALKPYPDARRAVAHVLQNIEAEQVPAIEGEVVNA